MNCEWKRRKRRDGFSQNSRKAVVMDSLAQKRRSSKDWEKVARRPIFTKSKGVTNQVWEKCQSYKTPRRTGRKYAESFKVNKKKLWEKNEKLRQKLSSDLVFSS